MSRTRVKDQILAGTRGSDQCISYFTDLLVVNSLLTASDFILSLLMKGVFSLKILSLASIFFTLLKVLFLCLLLFLVRLQLSFYFLLI